MCYSVAGREETDRRLQRVSKENGVGKIVRTDCFLVLMKKQFLQHRYTVYISKGPWVLGLKGWKKFTVSGRWRSYPPISNVHTQDRLRSVINSKNWGIEVSRCWGVEVVLYWGIGVLGYWGIQVCTYWDIEIWRDQGIEVSRHQSVERPRYLYIELFSPGIDFEDWG